MEGESSPPTTVVPVKISQPEDHAPPTLAQPASGPVAEMSGALKEGEQPLETAKEPSIESTEPAATNGVAEPPSQPTLVELLKPTEPTATTNQPAPISQDTEMTDEPAAEPSTEATAPEANGTASAEKKASNGKRKSTGGVPEHKNKKLNKKKSMTKLTHLDAKPGDYYFARLKSYPPWPSIVCDEEMLPTSLLSTRPVTTKQQDGTYREAYADGGKKENDRTFPVMFLHTNEFAWIPNTDLNPLDPAECKDVTEKGKAKTLIAAYHVAAEGHDLQHFKDMLADHARAIAEDEEMREAKAAEKAAKADKKKRKSEVAATAADDDIDMEDAEDAGETKKSSKKRKKEVDSDDEAVEKATKTPKTKIKLTTSKTPTTTEKKPKEKPAKKERKAKKSSVSDEDMADAEEKEPEKPVDPVEERKAREKEVLFLRHKLQKGFLSRDQAPQEDEMPQMSGYIKKLENYDELEVSIIRTTKINKVLKAIVKLNTIPKDEEFNFRARSMEMLSKMNKQLGGSDDAEPTAAATDKDSEPPTNGVSKEEPEKPKLVETAPDPAAEAPKTEITPSEPVAAAPIAEAVNSTTETKPEAPTEAVEPTLVSAPAPVASEPAKVESVTEAESTSAPAPPPVAAEATDDTKPSE